MRVLLWGSGAHCTLLSCTALALGGQGGQFDLPCWFDV